MGTNEQRHGDSIETKKQTKTNSETMKVHDNIMKAHDTVHTMS